MAVITNATKVVGWAKRAHSTSAYIFSSIEDSSNLAFFAIVCEEWKIKKSMDTKTKEVIKFIAKILISGVCYNLIAKLWKL